MRQRTGAATSRMGTYSLQLYLATTCLEGVRADVSHKGKISCQKSKRVKAEVAAPAVNCDWGRPENAALFACMRDRYIVLLFTSGSSAPSFRAPNTFWLKIIHKIQMNT